MKNTKIPSRLAASDDEIARLFESLEEDAPSRGAEAAILARLDADESGPYSTASPRSPGLRNVAVVGGLLVTLILGATVAVRKDANESDAGGVVLTGPTAAANVAAAPPRTAEPIADLAPTTSVSVEDLPAAPSRGAGTATSAPAPATTTASPGRVAAKDSFREQLAIVETARHSLSQGRADECLATLRTYDTKYPAGLFATEVRVVRIEALKAAGQSERAEALARELLRSDPHGAYSERLRSLLPKADGLDP